MMPIPSTLGGRTVATLLHASTVFGLLLVTSPSALQAADPDETKQEEIIRLTNQYRKAKKLPPLTSNEQLTKCAQDHAANMARQDKHGDDNRNGHVLDGKDFQFRIDASGYKYAGAGENTAMDRGTTVRAMVGRWMQSPTHRKNIIDPNFTEIGVGVAQSKAGRWYFVEVFAKPLESDK
jgi:uncharacterized protein YkwD